MENAAQTSARQNVGVPVRAPDPRLSSRDQDNRAATDTLSAPQECAARMGADGV